MEAIACKTESVLQLPSVRPYSDLRRKKTITDKILEAFIDDWK